MIDELVPQARAYIDPGTTGLVIAGGGGLLAPILTFLTAIFVALGFKKAGQYAKLTLGGIVLLIILTVAYLMQNYNTTTLNYKKILFIGIDALDPQITQQLIDEGKLPNLETLAKSGSFTELKTSTPPETPVAWTTIATGANPGNHGIYDYITRDAGTYLPRLTVNHQLKGGGSSQYVSPVNVSQWWQTTSDHDIDTSVYRWPLTFPPDTVKGNMLSGLGVPDIRGYLSGYSYYSEEDFTIPAGSSNHVVKVELVDHSFTSEVLGPQISKSGKISPSTTTFTGKLSDDSITITLNMIDYTINQGEWSQWIRVPFSTSFLSEVSGMFKAYLISTSPLKLYFTSIQLDPNSPILPITSPADYSKKLSETINSFYTLGMPEETAGLNDKYLTEEAFLSQIDEIENERDRMFWDGFDEFNSQDTGIYAFVYDSLDRLQHMFWEQERINPEIEKYYINKDRLIGEVLSKIDDKTNLLIASDHGFTSFTRAVNINTWLYKNGYLTLKSEPSSADPGSLFEYVDWSKTQVYALGFSSLFLNMIDREPNGTVSQEEKDQFLTKLTQDLQNLSDDAKPVIHAIYRGEEIYQGTETGSRPDLVIGFMPGYRMDWEAPIGGFTPEIIYDNTKHWRGDHLVDPSFVPGALFTNFVINTNSPKQTDIVPTILTILSINQEGGDPIGNSLISQ